MSATLLRLSFRANYLSKWQIGVCANRHFASRSDNLSADATAAAAQQRKIELKDPVGVDKLQTLFDDQTKNGDVIPVFKRALLHGNKVAIKDNTGEYSYRQILDAARKLSVQLSSHSYGECSTFYV